jgi:hypothetical protein
MAKIQSVAQFGNNWCIITDCSLHDVRVNDEDNWTIFSPR